MNSESNPPRQLALRDGTLIGDGRPPYLIAEVNTSHFGKLSVGIEMVERVANAGFDCVKFQSWNPESLYSSSFLAGNSVQRRMLSQFAFSPEELEHLSVHANHCGIAFSSTPYSLEQASWLVHGCNAPFVKVASMDITYLKQIREIAALGAPVILSTGMADMPEIRDACGVLGDEDIQFAILHCVSLYPTPIDAANVRNIAGLREVFPKSVVGFSDHTIGSAAAVASIALGASIIEKHVTPDPTVIGMDNQMALDLDRAAQFAHTCREAAQSLGSTDRRVSAAEHKQRRVMRRSLVATVDIPIGAKISPTDIAAYRPGDGLPADQIDYFIGRIATRNIGSGEKLLRDDAR